MPKRPTDAQIEEWRIRVSKGDSYKQIAHETGWDPRTVSAKVREELRTAEAGEIRRELFRDRLGRHWDMLIDEVIDKLKTLKEFDPWDYLERIVGKVPVEFGVTGAYVRIDPEWKVEVRTAAKDIRSWDLLQEHLRRDALWKHVDAWEAATASDLRARHHLYASTKSCLGKKQAWPVTTNRTEVTPSFAETCLEIIYEAALCRAIGIPKREITQDSLTEEPDGVIRIGGKTVAWAPGQQQAVYNSMTEAVEVLAKSEPAARAANARSDASDAAVAVRRALEDIRLLPYLPGVCSICRRVEI